MKGCIRCHGKIRLSLEWEPLTQIGEGNEIIRLAHSEDHQMYHRDKDPRQKYQVQKLGKLLK